MTLRPSYLSKRMFTTNTYVYTYLNTQGKKVTEYGQCPSDTLSISEKHIYIYM